MYICRGGGRDMTRIFNNFELSLLREAIDNYIPKWNNTSIGGNKYYRYVKLKRMRERIDKILKEEEGELRK